MADEINTGNVIHSVPNSPVVEHVQIKPFLQKTPIPSVEKVTSKWVQGAPTPIQEGQLTPFSEALNLLVCFPLAKSLWKGKNENIYPLFLKVWTVFELPPRERILMAVPIGLKRPK